jgi:hypothetical protein
VAIVVVEDSLVVCMETDHVLGLVRQVQDTLDLAAAVAVGAHCSLVGGLVVGYRDSAAHLAMAGLVANPFEGVGGIVVGAVDKPARDV